MVLENFCSISTTIIHSTGPVQGLQVFATLRRTAEHLRMLALAPSQMDPKLCARGKMSCSVWVVSHDLCANSPTRRTLEQGIRGWLKGLGWGWRGWRQCDWGEVQR